MNNLITVEQLIANDISARQAAQLVTQLNPLLSTLTTERAWQTISKEILNPQHPFKLHLFIFKTLFPDWPLKLDSGPAWMPEEDTIQSTNLYQLMSEAKYKTISEFHAWTTHHEDRTYQLPIQKMKR